MTEHLSRSRFPSHGGPSFLNPSIVIAVEVFVIGIVVIGMIMVGIVVVLMIRMLVIIVLVGVVLDRAGQLPAFDGHAEPSAELLGVVEHLREVLVDDLELGCTGGVAAGRHGRQGVVDELPFFEHLQGDLGGLSEDGLFGRRVEQMDRNGVGTLVVQ